MTDTPMPSARIAVTSGSSEASIAPPKTISRMASAAAMPTPTDRPRPGRSELVMDWPPSEIWTFGPVRGLRRADQFLGVARGDLSRLPVPGHPGEGDGALPADLRRPARPVRAAPRFRRPAPRPPWPAQRSPRPGPGGPDGGAALGLDHDLVALTRRGREVRRSAESPPPAESVSGRLRSVLKLLPAAALTPATATRASSQTATTLRRCAKHHRARRAMGYLQLGAGTCFPLSAPSWFRGQARRREPAGSICVHPPGVPGGAAGPDAWRCTGENRLLGVCRPAPASVTVRACVTRPRTTEPDPPLIRRLATRRFTDPAGGHRRGPVALVIVGARLAHDPPRTPGVRHRLGHRRLGGLPGRRRGHAVPAAGAGPALAFVVPVALVAVGLRAGGPIVFLVAMTLYSLVAVSGPPPATAVIGGLVAARVLAATIAGGRRAGRRWPPSAAWRWSCWAGWPGRTPGPAGCTPASRPSGPRRRRRRLRPSRPSRSAGRWPTSGRRSPGNCTTSWPTR